MHHCGNGPGPNIFDTLTALEGWVEHGIGPDGIIAAKFKNDDPTQTLLRTMPLCKFPEMARFHGDPTKPVEINDAAKWSCPLNDTSMLQVGPNGLQAGLGAHERQAAEGNDDRRDRDHDEDGHHDRD